MFARFKRWHYSSLRHQILVWLIAIAFIVLSIILLGSLKISRNLVEQNIYAQLEREHVIQSEIVEVYLNRTNSEFTSLANHPILQGGLTKKVNQQNLLFALINNHPLVLQELASIYAYDPEQNLLFSSVEGVPPALEYDALIRLGFQEKTGQAQILMVGGSHILALVQPIFYTGSVKPAGLLLMGLPLEVLISRLFQGRSDANAWSLGNKAGQDIVQNPKQSAEIAEMVGDIERSPLGTDSLLTRLSAKNSPWKVIKGQLRLQSPLDRLQLHLTLRERVNWSDELTAQLFTPYLLILGLTLAVLLALIIFAGRKLAMPLEDLTRLAVSIEQQGDPKLGGENHLRALILRQDEVGRLSTQFARMLQRLQLRHEGLEEQVAQRNRRLEMIFALSPDGFIEVNAQGVIGYLNPACVNLLGLQKDDFTGQTIDFLLTQLKNQLAAEHTSDAVLRRILIPSEQIHLLRLRHPLPRTLTLLCRKGEDGGFVLYVRDITQEAELEQLRSAFMSTAAHELRTPISSIWGYAQLLTKRLKGPNQPTAAMLLEMASVIERQSQNMAELINDLLDLSRLDHQIQQGLDLQTTSLAIYLRAVVSQFSLPDDGRHIVAHIDDHLPEVRLHPESFKRLIVNVLSNALKYSPVGSPIGVNTFSLQEEGQWWVGVSIEDHGKGMGAEHQAHLFERFYRGDAPQDVPGTGLGLAICKEIVEAHQGRITITSQLDVGTTVRLLFPALRKWGSKSDS